MSSAAIRVASSIRVCLPCIVSMGPLSFFYVDKKADRKNKRGGARARQNAAMRDGARRQALSRSSGIRIRFGAMPGTRRNAAGDLPHGKESQPLADAARA